MCIVTIDFFSFIARKNDSLVLHYTFPPVYIHNIKVYACLFRVTYRTRFTNDGNLHLSRIGHLILNAASNV